MEPFYYNHMNKNQQAAYRAMQQGLINLSDEFQIPRLEGKDLSNVFFELRLDHPEIFWASGFKYKYYPDSQKICGSITRRFSGLPALNISITQIPRT